MNNKAFTLVEILIVVIILGILAAIVIPQFTQASGEAKLSSLASDLQMVRSQMQLYYLQHNDTYPGDTGAEIINGGVIACYRPATDTIHMPDEERFFDTESATRTQSY